MERVADGEVPLERERDDRQHGRVRRSGKSEVMNTEQSESGAEQGRTAACLPYFPDNNWVYGETALKNFGWLSKKRDPPPSVILAKNRGKGSEKFQIGE